MKRLNLFFVISAILAVPLNVGYAALPTEGFIASFGTPVDIASVNDIVYAMKSVDMDYSGPRFLDSPIRCKIRKGWREKKGEAKWQLNGKGFQRNSNLE